MKDEERKGIREAFGKAYGYVSIPFFFLFSVSMPPGC